MTNLLRKAVAPALAAIVLIYIVLKVVVYLRVTDQFDKFVNMASLFADVRYEGVSSDLLKGQAAIEGISIVPHGFGDKIGIDKLIVQGDGPGMLFADAESLSRTPPERFLLAFRGVRVALIGGMADAWASAARASIRQRLGSLPSSCDFGGTLMPNDLVAMGLDELVTDLVVRMDYDPVAQNARFDIDYEMHEIGDLSIKISLRGKPNVMAPPKLANMVFNYRPDADFWLGLNRYCGQVTGRGERVLIEQAFAASDADWARLYNFIPGPGLRDAFRRFLEAPGEVELSVVPPENFNPMLVSQISPNDLPGILHLRFTVNGQAVDDLSYRLALPDELRQTLGLADSSSAAGSADGASADKPRAMIRRAYQDTPVAELPKYIGARVRLHLRNGPMRFGELAAVKSGSLTIERRMQGGKFATSVDVAELSRVEVYRPVPAEK